MLLYNKLYCILKVVQTTGEQPVKIRTLKDILYLLHEYVEFPYRLRFSLYDDFLYSHEVDLYLDTLTGLGYITANTDNSFQITSEGLKFITDIEQDVMKLKNITGFEQPVVFPPTVIDFIKQCANSDPFVVTKMANERYLAKRYSETAVSSQT